jgi:CubicO group peptidase (beta-lactamase class C family)
LAHESIHEGRKTPMDEFGTVANPDLTVSAGNQPTWNQPDNRRHGFHNLYRLTRYWLSLRAARIQPLYRHIDPRIVEMPEVRRLTALPQFSAMVILRGPWLLFERYASDFGPDRAHSIQSITKTTMNLIVGQLVDAGAIDLDERVATYVPEIGTGYANATVQQVLNMDVANDYTEDYDDPFCKAYFHEEAEGFRLPVDYDHEQTMRGFIAGIGGKDTTNRSGTAQYKSANSDVLAWIAERVSGRALRGFLADIVDAAGLDGRFHMATDREGVPVMNSGACLTARDLARFGSLFVRRGRGGDGRVVGGPAFIERSLAGGLPMTDLREGLRYSNHANTDGRWLGHGGYAGQFMLADLTSGVVGVFFSVLENQTGYDAAYYSPIIEMLAAIGRLDFSGDLHRTSFDPNET